MTKNKTCPYCAEEINAAAVVCRHCTRELAPIKAQPVASPQAQAVAVTVNNGLSCGRILAASLLALLVCSGCGVVLLVMGA
jgi:hypothetical protein